MLGVLGAFIGVVGLIACVMRFQWDQELDWRADLGVALWAIGFVWNVGGLLPYIGTRAQ